MVVPCLITYDQAKSLNSMHFFQQANAEPTFAERRPTLEMAPYSNERRPARFVSESLGGFLSPRL